MRNTWAIFKREMSVYFTSPIAYAVTIIFLVITGYFFAASLSAYSIYSLQAFQNPQLKGLNLADMVVAPMMSNMAVIMLLMLPALTMRLMSEEKKSGAHELLFTYPVRDIEVVLGKYLAALAVFAVMLALTSTHQLFLLALGKNTLAAAAPGYLGLLLLGGAFIALGLMVSTLTENQIVAAVVSFGLLLLLWVAGWSASFTSSSLGEVLKYISIVTHFEGFAKGLIDTKDLAYYLLFIFSCLFLSLRSLESKRWRG